MKYAKNLNGFFLMYFTVALLLNSVNGNPGIRTIHASGVGKSQRVKEVHAQEEISISEDDETPTSEIELSISARQLNGDQGIRTNLLCIVYIRKLDTSQWIEYGRTETNNDKTNHYNIIDFASKIAIRFQFGEQQPFKFEIFEFDLLLGFAVCTLTQIISTGRGKLQVELLKKNDDERTQATGSYIIVTATEMPSSNELVVLELHGRGLMKKWFEINVKPFIEVYRSSKSNGYILVHRTEAINNTTAPRWMQFSVSNKTLSDGDYDRPVRFVCRNWNSNGKHARIGEFETSLRQLRDEKKTSFSLIHPESKKKPKFKIYGFVDVAHFDILSGRSFLDHVIGGLPIHCVVGIDFSIWNGDKNKGTSLHYVERSSTDVLNPYEQAILSLLSALEDYCTVKQFPVYGFGAILPGENSYSKKFHVNMDRDNPVCTGVRGVLEAYRNCLQQITMTPSVDLADLILEVDNMNREDSNLGYYILLLLTTGQITESAKEAAIQAIIEASTEAVSIVIIGMGEGNFKNVKILDADEGPLLVQQWNETTFIEKRDIVQFVGINALVSNDLSISESRLAKEALVEIPKQIVSYMLIDNLYPGSPTSNPISVPSNTDRVT